MYEMMNQIYGGGWASVITVIVGILAGWAGPKVVKPVAPTPTPTPEPAHDPRFPKIRNLISLLIPDSIEDNFPILEWAAKAWGELSPETRAELFVALRKRVAGR
jgi:hypothetical protein